MKKPMQTCFSVGLGVLAAAACGSSALAQDTSQLPPVAVYQAMLDASRQTGWVQFRNYAGSQWVYFTPLQTMHCRLKEIRYSVNSKDLESRFALVPCNPQSPFALPADAGPDAIAIRLEPGTAKTVAVQAVWEDGTETGIAVYAPCENVGEQSCARSVE